MNVYRRHTTLRQILWDSWARNLSWEQTASEASAAGFANCVVWPVLPRYWCLFDQQWKDYLNSVMPGERA